LANIAAATKLVVGAIIIAIDVDSPSFNYFE
jgi:hypothetical protein